MDHVWTAMRFKKVDQLPNKNRAFVEFKAADIKVDDFEKIAPLVNEMIMIEGNNNLNTS